MKLIKDLDIRETISKNGISKKYRFALFLCPVCGNEAERKKTDGIKQKRCCGGKSKISPKGSPLHGVYIGMTQRCKDINSISYKNYGGRGISVCKAWNNFDNFARWALSNGYKQGVQIDRRDNNGNYCPENCRFVTSQENAQNTRNSIHSPDKIREIKRLYIETPMTYGEIAKIAKDSEGNIANIMRGRTWANIETEYDRDIDVMTKIKTIMPTKIRKLWLKQWKLDACQANPKRIMQ